MEPNKKPRKNGFLNLFHGLNISHETLMDLAFESQLIRRRRGIDPADLLTALCIESSQGTVSHNDLAAQLQSDTGVSVSKISVWKKINTRCLDFLKKVFELVIRRKFAKNSLKPEALLFDRVVVQDSTIIRLPMRLFNDFSGVANAHSKVCNSRIQGVYDIVAERFLSFSIDSYSKVDYEAAPELVLEKGDLTLRDRGYLTADEIQRHIDLGADCIYRHKYKLILLDPVGEKPIDLLALLKKKNSIDMEINLNNKARTKVRLLAFPVNQEIACNRRRKAKKENKKLPNADYLELLGWSIYLTTVRREIADAKKIFGLYKLRWRIEIIFKSWKSNMAFDRVHNVSKIQLWVILWARFIMIVICTQMIYTPCRFLIKAKLDKNLSLMKVTHYLIRHPKKLPLILKELKKKHNKLGPMVEALAKYCSYDKRKRINYQEEMEITLSLS